MIRKIKSNKRKKNISVILIAFVIVFMFLYLKKTGFKNDENLQSNIFSIRNTQVTKTNPEIIYEFSSGKVEVFSNTVLENLSGMDILFYFDSEKVKIVNKDIFSDYDFDIQKDTGSLRLTMKTSGKLEKNQKIVFLNISGDSQSIVLGEILTKINDGTNKKLSIGLK